MMDICRLTSGGGGGAEDGHHHQLLDDSSLKMVEIDFQALCRICGALGENLTSVFGKRAADRLRERIGKYLQIDILAEDCLPTKVCDGCRETLDRFHELFEKCHRTDEKFRTMMNAAEELKDVGMGVVGEGEEEEEEDEKDGTAVEEEEQQQQQQQEEQTEEEEGVEAEVPAAAKKRRGSKRESQQEDLREEEAQEKQGDHLLRYSIRRIVSFQVEPPEPSATEDYPASGGGDGELAELEHEQQDEEDFYGDYQFLEPNFDSDVEEADLELEEEPMASSSSSLARAPMVRLLKDLVDQGKIIVDGKTIYQCRECGKRLVSPYSYQAHLRIHNGARPFACPQCQQTFRIAQGLARHVREVHAKQRNYSCEICGKRFGNSRNLKEHRNLHTGEKPHSCDQCGKSYKQKAALHMHKRTHATQHRFSCSICPSSFYTRTKLQIHETTHSDERAYGCDLCERTFRSGHNLARHRKCHTTENPFQCAVCDVQFKQKRYLMRHLSTQQHHQQNQGAEDERKG